MNPVDHPHGGGEGKSKGNHPQSPWGQPTKGYTTRHNPRTDRFIVKRRKHSAGARSWHAQSRKVRSSTAICSRRSRR